MLVHDLITTKRDGGRITRADWHVLARGCATGEFADFQLAALLMACFLRGLDREETSALTEAMLSSGARLDLSGVHVPRVDKHSTGGVGDKVSIVLAPLVSCLGVAVPMMSGRGLGHTGGTIDKLESIPGFRTALSTAEVSRQVERIGCALFAQSAEIAPADRRLYALRDATATVESIPLIAASIMSKKLAEGLGGLVLDVKRGSGAFLPELERGMELAQTMIALGADHACPVVALLTAMDRPLGRACGNALEVEESIHALKGEGPPDLLDVTLALGAEMLVLGGVAKDPEDARRRLRDAIATGRAAEQLQRIIEAQGGNPAVVDDPALLPQAHQCEFFVAPRSGFVARVEPRPLGHGIIELGGGRTQIDAPIDPSVGFVITAKPGDWVDAAEPLATVFAANTSGIDAGRACLARAIVIADEAEPPLPLISHRVTPNGVERYATR